MSLYRGDQVSKKPAIGLAVAASAARQTLEFVSHFFSGSSPAEIGGCFSPVNTEASTGHRSRLPVGSGAATTGRQVS